jgi:PAS domain S-box-containing protein
MENLDKITQHLLRFSPDALIVINESREICFANETVFDLLGYRPSELLGKALEVLLPERLRERHVDHVVGYMRSPANRDMGARIADLKARRADGSEFAAGIRLAPFQIGERRYTAAAIRDITEMRRVSDALVEAREESDRANRAKSRFLATASHDLRQPLQAIRLLNASMFKMSDSEQLSEMLTRQGQAIEGMAYLLNGLLDISRLESGNVEPRSEEVHLAELLEELRSDFESLAKARMLTFGLETLDVVLSTDRVLLRQLLENLLGNALKYTERGGIRVRCAASADALTIEILDTGVGIPQDKIDRIFDEYYQVDTHGVRRMGVGLGLAIVREVARLLGFSIKISSRVGVGTQVQVIVPVQRLVKTPVKMTAPAMLAPVPAGNRFRPRLILLEDNDAVRRATEIFLALEDFEVASAASAAEAVALFSAPQGDEVLLADFHLEGSVTGLDVLADIRRRTGKQIPAVIMSGDLPTVKRSIKEPVPKCEFLSKPVDVQELMRIINAFATHHD